MAPTPRALHHFFEHRLLHHMEDISSILFFLLGAMTIVELVDAHEGFSVITDRIKTSNKVKLMWILSLLTFFFSAVLDNHHVDCDGVPAEKTHRRQGNAVDLRGHCDHRGQRRWCMVAHR